MSHPTRWLPIAALILIGCERPAPVAPTAGGQDAPRVLAVARDLERAQKTKQAIAAYHQVVLYFPNTPEAKEAAKRISEVQRAATRKPVVRKAR